MKRLCSLFASMLFFTLAAFGDGPSQYRLVVSGAFPSPNKSAAEVSVVRIYYDGSNVPQECILDRPQPSIEVGSGFTCSVIAIRKAMPRAVRIEVARPGFRMFSRNIVELRFQRLSKSPLLGMPIFGSKVDLGIVTMAPTELPLVEEVLRSKASDGSTAFDIIINNKFPRELLIKQLKIDASRPGIYNNCCCPPTAVFSVTNEIKLVTAKGDHRQSIAGTYEEKLNGSNYQIEATGQIDFDPCSRVVKLSLNFPVAVGLPPNQFTRIRIILPSHLKITKAVFINGKELTVPEPALINDGDLEVFTEFTFTLASNIDDLSIIALYDRR